MDQTTVTFENVTNGGLTNILINPNAPALPSGEGAIGFVYNINTTCTPSGTITVEMTYLDEVRPERSEETAVHLPLRHRQLDLGGHHRSRDPVNNVMTGVTDRLSPFGMVTRTALLGHRVRPLGLRLHPGLRQRRHRGRLRRRHVPTHACR